MITLQHKLDLFRSTNGLAEMAKLGTEDFGIASNSDSGFPIVHYHLRCTILGGVAFGFVVTAENELVVAPFAWDRDKEGFDGLAKIALRQARRRHLR